MVDALVLGRQGKDEAIEKFTYLIDRLAKMPEARRQAQDQRLQIILEQSMFGLQSYHARRNRLDETVTAYGDVIDAILDEDAYAVWRENQARVFWWQGRHEAAAEILRVEVDKDPFDVNLRGLLFSIFVDDDNLDQAEAVIVSLAEELEDVFGTADSDRWAATAGRIQRSSAAQSSSEEADSTASLQFGFLHYLRSSLALEKGEWEEAFNEFAKAAKASAVYTDLWRMLYQPLVVRQHVRLANRALNREKLPASQGFWRGLSGNYAGDQQGARAEWRRVTQIPLDEVTPHSVGDWILAHYYLDANGSSRSDRPDVAGIKDDQAEEILSDEDRRGLQVAMHLLQQPDTRRDPQVLCLAALGWGIYGHKEHLQRNVRHALEQLRAGFLDSKLPVLNWYFFRDLLQPEDFAEVEQYFHRPKA